MNWKCPICGFSNARGGRGECAGGCGHIRYHAVVQLVSASNGQTVRMTINTEIGKALLRPLVGEDAAFVSEPQFRIYKDPDLAAWAIRHLPGAKNPTYYQGAALADTPRPLTETAAISIGPERARMTVQLIE